MKDGEEIKGVPGKDTPDTQEIAPEKGHAAHYGVS